MNVQWCGPQRFGNVHIDSRVVGFNEVAVLFNVTVFSMNYV
jgi:hypothetical protein